MELQDVRGGTKQDLDAYLYNIGVGISLGNKWFTVDNIVELIAWSLPRTRDKVIVYVADSIHAINLEVRNKISPKAALRRALERGTKILSEVRETAAAAFSPEDSEKIVYATWSDLVDETYKEKVAYLYELYVSNTEFAEYIKNIVRNSVAKEEKTFSDEEITRLGHYILEELPELISRPLIQGVPCDAYVYPFAGEIAPLAERIQNGEIFPEIKTHILNTEPKVFLEVR